jgi:hypothetical protein
MEQNKEEQKKLLTEIMEADAKDELYKQQTVVEWTFEQMPFEYSSSRAAFEVYLQAKEIHRQQIIDAVKSQCIFTNTQEIAERYYQQTFKK